MKHHYAHILWVLPVQGTRLAKNSMLFFGVMFLMFFSSWSVVGQGAAITSPGTPDPTSDSPIPITIEFEDGVDNLNIIDFTVTNGNLSDLQRLIPDFKYLPPDQILKQFEVKTNIEKIIDEIELDFDKLGNYLNDLLADAVVSIDYNGNNELFYLTYGNGLFKSGQTNPVIGPDEFDTPLDFVINRNNGKIYIADSGKKQVLVYDSNYIKLKPIGSGIAGESDGPRGATGLALDIDGNIYVADNFTEGYDAIKAYKPNGTLLFPPIYDYEGSPIKDPFRIAVDFDGNIFLSDSGEGTGRVLIYNKNRQPIKKIKGGKQGTPGSLITDQYGYLYVVDFADEFNLNDLFNEPLNVLENYNNLKNANFSINVFDPETNFGFLKELSNINLPIDITIDQCGLLKLNDLQLGGEGVDILKICPFGPFGDCYNVPKTIDATFNFSLKTLKKQDIFSAEIIPEVPGPVTVSLKDGTLFKCDPQPKATFSIEYKPEDTTAPEAKCKPATLSLDADGNATLTAAQVYDGDASADNVTLEIDKENFDCSNLGANTVTLTVTGENGKIDTCDAVVTVADDTAPTANCVGPFTIQLDTNGEASITEADINNNSTDNCGIENYSLSQSNFTRADVGVNTVLLTVTDTSGLKSECPVQVTVEDNNVPEATCKPVTLSLDADGNATLTAAQVYDGDATADNVTLKIDKENFDCSNLGANTVTLTITGENGKTAICEAMVTIIDKIPPTVSCPQDILVEYTTDKTYTVPDFSTLYASSDNCSSTLSYSQNPAFNTVITDDTPASFRVADENGNSISCPFNIIFFKNTELQITNCPTSRSFEVDEDCSYLVPDIASTIETNLEGATVTQDIAPGFRLNGSHRLTITAKFEDQIATCEIELIAKDSIDPVVSCPEDQNETFDPENGFSLPNYILLAQTSDNCAVAKIEQIPDVGTVIFEDTEVTLRVEDLDGNVASCTFQVFLNEETVGNTPPVAKDDAYVTAKDISLTVSSPGVLGNDSDEDGDELTAVIQSPPASGTLAFNSDGSFTYTPNSGFTGEVTFTYAANDGTENSNIASVTITVTEPSGDTVVCKESLTIGLDENGIANLNASELFISRPENLQFSVNKEIFTCDELGENTVTLSYSNNEVQASCDVTIIVEDVSAPILGVKDISVALNEFGSVSITPEMLDNGSSDNCGELSLSVDKSNFGCKELG
ncbi:Ig-like domain-containing protein [Gillisia sp. Hel_I_86]|uniref:Ig-like domain-containing protein n=1 Tax=Gillisia sp. Hel_I_86 TaxID=1249981 RepID=UPI0011A7E1CF|nr:Ig-like domain-containing protein [Gillisia sp. Hel_I_86]